MAKSFTSLFFLFALALLTAVSLAARRCPNKCLRPKSKAVLQCRKGPRRALCSVKRCRNRRGWRCARQPARETPSPTPSPQAVACTPVSEEVGMICSRGDGCSPTVEGTERNFEIGCACGFGSSFSSEDNIVTDGLKEGEVTCFVDCMKEKSCLAGACTPGPELGDIITQCGRKERIQSRNVRKTSNQRTCCEDCGGSLIFRKRAPSVGDDFICIAA